MPLCASSLLFTIIAICVDFSHISTMKHSNATDSEGFVIKRCLKMVNKSADSNKSSTYIS